MRAGAAGGRASDPLFRSAGEQGDVRLWRRRAEMLDAALGVLEDQVYVVDGDGRILYANLAAARSIGVARSDLEGRTWTEIYTGTGPGGEHGSWPEVPGSLAVAAAFEQQVRTTFETGRQTTAIYTTPVPYLRDFEVTLTPIFALDGKSVDYICDVSRLMAAPAPAHTAARPGHQMTARQRKIVELIARGLAYREIAVELVISVRTVETHRRIIAERFGLRTRAELFRYAQEQGWI